MSKPSFALPSVIRLDTLLQPGGLRLEPQPQERTGYRSAHWRATGPDPARDTLALGWTMDPRYLFSPVLAAELAPRAGGHAGWQWVSTDAVGGRPSPRRLLVAHRTSCQ